jgi:hypothetical protein
MRPPGAERNDCSAPVRDVKGAGGHSETHPGQPSEATSPQNAPWAVVFKTSSLYRHNSPRDDDVAAHHRGNSVNGHTTELPPATGRPLAYS